MGAQPRDFSLVERIAFRSGDEMFNISNSPNQSTELPDALIYSPPLVGPLARPVHAAASIGSRRSSPGDDLDTALKTIATVVAHGKPRYTVDIAGIERVEGHRAYHLRLQPALDPGRFSLRDLWVDTETYDLWKAHYIVTNYSPSESSLASEKDDITVYFVGAGPYWIAASWEDYSLSINGPVHVVNRNLTVTFPAKLPDWLFEKKAYAEHQRAKDPDYLTHIFDRPTPQPEESGKDSRLRITAHS